MKEIGSLPTPIVTEPSPRYAERILAQAACPAAFTEIPRWRQALSMFDKLQLAVIEDT
jgi:hypothetical protein